MPSNDNSFQGIRRATRSDFAQILEAHQNSIREIASQDHDSNQISAWSDHLSVDGYLKAEENGEEYFVAEENNKILGFSSIKNDTIMAVYVSSLGKGRGIGKALYEVLENLTKKRKIKKLFLTSSLTARDFYKKMGFLELEEIEHKFKAGATVRAFKMEKVLDKDSSRICEPANQLININSLNIYNASGDKAVAKVKPVYQEHFGRSNISNEDIFFIVEDKHKIVGVVRLCREYSIHLLRSMFVHPEYRKQGLGKKLLNEFERYLNEHEIKNVFCLPWGYLEDFYAGIGFNRCSSDSVPKFLQDRLLEYQSRNDDEIIFMVRRESM